MTESDSDDVDVKDSIRALRWELRALRGEVEALKKAQDPAPQSAPKPDAQVFGGALPTVRSLLGSTAPIKPATGPLALPRGPAAAAKMASAWRFDEKFVGERLMQYAGMVVLAIGVVFFLVWRATHTGPAERVFMAASLGAGLLGLGLKARARERFGELAQTLIGGGWTVLFVTGYAAYHFPPTRILDAPWAGLAVLCLVAAGMVGHALAAGSRAFRVYAFGLTYFVFAFCREEVTTFDLFLLLHAACVLIASKTGEADVLLVSLAGFHLSYLPVYLGFMRHAGSESQAEFLRVAGWQAGAYLAVSAVALWPKARARLLAADQQPLLDAALVFNALALAAFGGTLLRAHFGGFPLRHAAVLSAFFAVPGLAYARLLPGRSNGAGLYGILALGMLAGGIFEMPDPLWKLVAWSGVSCLWVWVGLLFNAPVWRVSGLTMALLTFLFYVDIASHGAAQRRSASVAMLVFSGLSYLYARFYRLWLSGAEEWEKPAGEFWLYAGTAGLILALWGLLEAAPFLCALVALTVAGEVLAVRLPRLHLWVQASALGVGLGAYSLFVDYGANASVAGVSARLLVTGVMAAGWAYLYFADPMEDALASGWSVWSRAGQRRLLTWVALAAVSFTIYKEFGGRVRLPIWAFASAFLYLAGRLSADATFKRQAIILALGVGAEAAFSYLTVPSVMLGGATLRQTVFYWSSCLALLGTVAVAKARRWGSADGFDAQGAAMLSLLSLILMASYCAKELDAVQLTMAWTALGMAYLLGGLAAGWRELRVPALWLLAVCVGKALLFDTSQLPLPYRVASFVGLGVVLLGASSLYVRMDHAQQPASADDR